MENKITADNLRLDNDAASFLYKASGWAKFMAIFGLVSIGVSLVSMSAMSLLMNPMMEALSPSSSAAPGMASMFTTSFMVMMVTILVLALVPYFFLLKFATRARKSVLEGDSLTLTHSMAQLKNYFMYLGIMTIVSIGLSVVVVLTVAIGAGVAAASGAM